MDFTETGHRREERPDLPVSLLRMFHVLQFECEKSIALTVSSIALVSSVQAEKYGRNDSIRVSPHWGSDEGAIEGLAHYVPTCDVVLPTAMWDTLFGCK